MARKIAIIGLGHVGAAIAHGLITTGGADELIFIDTNSAKAEAEALDFQDAAANLKYDVHIVVNDWQALNDADIVISTLGQISLQKTGQATGDRFVELQFTKQQVRGVADKIVASGFHGVLVVVTNPVDVITALYQRFTGFPANRVIVSGTLLDTARMQRAVGVALGVNPKSVSGYNLGEHGNSQFTAWSTVRVHGELVGDDADLNLDALEDEARRGGYTVYAGKEFTSYGIASATIHLVEAVLSDSHEVLPVSTYQTDLETYLSYPVVVGRAGVLHKAPLQLTGSEQQKLTESAAYIKQRFDDVYAELAD